MKTNARSFGTLVLCLLFSVLLAHDKSTILMPGITITESGGNTMTSETGTTDDFTVVLDAAPTIPVVITVVSGNAAENMVAPALLTFTPADWNIPQTVTVTGVDDPVTDGDQTTTITLTAAGDIAYIGMVATVIVTNADDEMAGLTVVESGGSTMTSEDGTTDDFTVVLDAQPTLPVTVAVAGTDATENTAAPALLVFTAANWNVPQTITVTGVDDPIVDGDQTSTILLSVTVGDPAYLGESASVTVVNQDNEIAGISIVESGGMTMTSEDGTADDFTVVLDGQPVLPVIITVITPDLDENTVAPAVLTFTPVNWNVPQTVTVTGVDDPIVDGDQNTTITLTAAGDPAYLGLMETVNSINKDNDVVGLTIVESGGMTMTSEDGTTDDFTVVLDSEPLIAVTFTVTVVDATENLVNPLVLVFDATNWNVPQTVTVTGVDDPITDGDITHSVTITGLAGDPAYIGLIETVNVTNKDNEMAGITITESGGMTMTSEDGTTDDVTVVLDAQPLLPVVITVAPDDPTENTAAPLILNFDNTNWNVPQTVTVTGVDDPLVDGDITSNLTFTILGVDPAYIGITESISIVNKDNDTANITIVESGGMTMTSEDGTTDDFTVVLESQPLIPVIITVITGDATENTVAPTTLTFDGTNWNVPQTVTVTGVDDPLTDGDQTTTITLTALGDLGYTGMMETVSVINKDNELAGITIVESGGMTMTSEDGTTDDFTVVLESQPILPVIVTVASGDVSENTVDPITLIFTSANWNVPQTVTVTGVDDPITDGDQTTTITLAIAGVDPAFIGITETVSVINKDNDTAGITIVESGGMTMTSEDCTTDDFTVVLDSEPLLPVIITVVSGDITENTATPATLTFTPANWSVPQTVTVKGVDDPLTDGDQTTIITLTAAGDLAYLGVMEMVSVVNKDNDVAGIIVTESDGMTMTTEGGMSDDFTVVLETEPLLPVVITIVTGDATENTVDPLTLTFLPANWNIPQTVTVNGVDDPLTDGDQTTIITLTAAGDIPYISLMETVTVINKDDETADLIIIESDGMTMTSEDGTTDDFTVQLSNEPLLPVVVTVLSGDVTENTVTPATLTFTTANWNIPQTVTVNGVDDPLVDGDQTVTITLTAAGDLAYLGLMATVTSINKDNETASITVVESDGMTMTSEDGTTDDFTVVLDEQPVLPVIITVTSSDLSENTAAPVTLTFTPANWNVPQTVTVTGVDDPLVDGDITHTIDLTATGDLGYLGLMESVTVINKDNETPSSTATINDVEVVEGTGGATTSVTFTVSLDVAPGIAATIEYMTMDGTATDGSDYLGLPAGVVAFTALQTSQTITVLVNHDADVELNETFSVILKNPVGTVIGDDTGVATIINDDDPFAGGITLVDPCVCDNNESASGAQDGTFSETITVRGAAAGETYTVIAVRSATGGSTPPTGIEVGDVLTVVANPDSDGKDNDGDGIVDNEGAGDIYYEFEFNHSDDSGYELVVEGPNALMGVPMEGTPEAGNFQETISNVCEYASISNNAGIASTYTTTDPAVTSAVVMENTPGANSGPNAGNVVFSVSPALTGFVDNTDGTFTFDPAMGAAGTTYTVTATFSYTGTTSNTGGTVADPAFPDPSCDTEQTFTFSIDAPGAMAIGTCTGITAAEENMYHIRVSDLDGISAYGIDFDGDGVDDANILANSGTTMLSSSDPSVTLSGGGTALSFSDGTQSIIVQIDINDDGDYDQMINVHEVVCTDADDDGDLDYGAGCDEDLASIDKGYIVATAPPYNGSNVYVYVLTDINDVVQDVNTSGIFTNIPNGGNGPANDHNVVAFNFSTNADAQAFISSLTVGTSTIDGSEMPMGCSMACGVSSYDIECFECPDISNLTVTSPICSGDDIIDLTATIANFHNSENGAVDFDVEFIYSTTQFTTAADVYSMGTSIGTVDITAAGVNAAIAPSFNLPDVTTTSTFYLYARIDEEGMIPDPNCRPYAEVLIIVNPSPVADVIANPASICPGDDAVFNITGTAGAQITYNINGAGSLTVTLDGAGMATVTIPSVNADQTLTLLSAFDPSNGCSSTLTGFATVSIISMPTATVIANPMEICEGEDAIFEITGTPSAMITYNINGGGNMFVMLDIAGNGMVTIAGVTADQTIALTMASLGSCNETLDESAVVTITALPSATIAVDNNMLCSTNNTATLTISGNAGDMVVYSVNGVNQPPITIDADGSTEITISPSENTTYALVSVENAAGTCSQDLSDSVMVTVDNVDCGNYPWNGVDE